MNAPPLFLWKLTNPRSWPDATPEAVGDHWIAEAIVVAPDADAARRVWPVPGGPPRGPRGEVRRQIWAPWRELDVARIGRVDPEAGYPSGHVVYADERDATTWGTPHSGPVAYLLAERAAPGRVASLVLGIETARLRAGLATAPLDIYAVPADMSDPGWIALAVPVREGR